MEKTDDIVDKMLDEAMESVTTEKIIKEKKKLKNKKIIIWILFILLFVLFIFLIIRYFLNKEKNISCELKTNDKEFSLVEKYDINVKKERINLVINTFEYKSKSSDFNNILATIKDEKTDVIINSNGMKGFTYVEEETDDSLKIIGYLDYSSFDFKEINKVDQSKKPLAYYKITNDYNYKNLIEVFEKKGYTCTNKK